MLRLAEEVDGFVNFEVLAAPIMRHKTGCAMQYHRMFVHRLTFLLCPYFLLAYALFFSPDCQSDYIFPDFAEKVMKDGKKKLDTRTSKLFSVYYNNLMDLDKKMRE